MYNWFTCLSAALHSSGTVSQVNCSWPWYSYSYLPFSIYVLSKIVHKSFVTATSNSSCNSKTNLSVEKIKLPMYRWTWWYSRFFDWSAHSPTIKVISSNLYVLLIAFNCGLPQKCYCTQINGTLKFGHTLFFFMTLGLGRMSKFMQQNLSLCSAICCACTKFLLRFGKRIRQLWKRIRICHICTRIRHGKNNSWSNQERCFSILYKHNNSLFKAMILQLQLHILAVFTIVLHR